MKPWGDMGEAPNLNIVVNTFIEPRTRPAEADKRGRPAL
jgi:hypothetical protein